ncbi:MAG: DUF6804 family protein [Bryobacteraceae bacterium]
MSTLVGSRESPSEQQLPLVKPLDEARWHAWTAKGRALERRSSAARVRAVKLILVGGLLAVAGLWSQFAAYEVVVRFLVAWGAIFVMFQSFRARRYAFAAVFGALALLFNPIAPVFSLSGDWQRAVVVMSAVPFVASLAQDNSRMVSE